MTGTTTNIPILGGPPANLDKTKVQVDEITVFSVVPYSSTPITDEQLSQVGELFGKYNEGQTSNLGVIRVTISAEGVLRMVVPAEAGLTDRAFQGICCNFLQQAGVQGSGMLRREVILASWDLFEEK